MQINIKKLSGILAIAGLLSTTIITTSVQANVLDAPSLKAANE